MKVLIAGLLALVVIVGGGYALLHKSPTSNSSTVTSQLLPDTIEYTDSGFIPQHLTVSSGTMVTIKNTTASPMQFNSNPHPLHTDDLDLNVGPVGVGQSKTFTVTKKGTFGYHNHLQSGDQGTITIN